jgi:uncharacterized protein (TIGR00255 family)
MLRSMTAFARQETRADWGTAVWELRSVNHRYLDIFVRMPEELRALETQVRGQVAARLRRGKVECFLRFQAMPGEAATIEVNSELAEQLVHASREVDQMLYNPAPVHSMDVLRWPGVVATPSLDLEAIGAAVLAVLGRALDEIVQTRSREGKKIAAFLGERLDEMPPLVANVRERLPAVIQGMREKLHARLAELKAELDEQRLEQEIVIFAQKVDVAEELDRLETHVAEVRRVLGQGQPAGRRLDFLMQELNREANTLSSKSADAETTRVAVELKVIIEQMREQAQNVE